MNLWRRGRVKRFFCGFVIVTTIVTVLIINVYIQKVVFSSFDFLQWYVMQNELNDEKIIFLVNFVSIIIIYCDFVGELIETQVCFLVYEDFHYF